MGNTDVIACPGCDLHQAVGPLAPGGAALCGRCGDRLHRRPRRDPQYALALVVTAVALFAVGNSFPLVVFELAGHSQSGLLVSGVIALYREGYWELAALVGFTTMVAPAAYLAGLFYVLLAQVRARRLPFLRQILRAVRGLTPWAMMEVYSLGILVAVVKLGDYGALVPGIALAAFLCLALLVVAINRDIDEAALWRLAAAAGDGGNAAALGSGVLWSCAVCGLLMRPLAGGAGARGDCPRCGSAVAPRKPDSLSRTWALLLAGFVLYIPANLLPVMTIVSFGQQQTSTILGGVIELAQAGMWPIAGIVFLASIAIPVLKLVSLTLIAASVHWRWSWRPAERTRLYRIVEGIGRWSMIDVFMVSILVALVNLGVLAQVEPDLGAAFFCAVVIITMFAASSFDPRLIWDDLEQE